MDIKTKYLNYGQQVFIKRKKLSTKEIANWLKDKPDAIVKGDFVVNAEELLTKNWKEFANWVNIGLIKGEIKGKAVSLSNGSEEKKQEYREILSQLDKRVVELHSWVKGKDRFPSLGSWMHLFYTKIGVERRRVGNLDSDYLITRYYGDYLQIVEDNLIEQFKEFVLTRK